MTQLPKTRIHVGGYEIDVRRMGAGNAVSVVLVHGIGVSGDYFLRLARLLGAHYDVYILDLPGYGTTPKPPYALGIAALADIVREFCQTLSSSRLVVIGHSMGCQVVAHAAAISLARVQCVILLAPTVPRGERTRIWQLVRLLQNSLFEPPALNAIIVRDYWRMGLARYWQTSALMVADRIETYMPLLKGPALLLRGERDKIVSASWLNTLADVAPRSRRGFISRAAHGAHFSRPEAVARRCRAFIDAE